MKCKCGSTMEYGLGMWECDECEETFVVLDTKVSNAILISDEEDFYCTDEKALHLN